MRNVPERHLDVQEKGLSAKLFSVRITATIYTVRSGCAQAIGWERAVLLNPNQ